MSSEGHEEIHLTRSDERILDRIWDSVTDEEIEQSIMTLEDDMGGKPSRGTPADKRLKENRKPAPKKGGK